MTNSNTKEDKNWLIRTRHRQILGPVSKKKIVEFVEKGSLGPDDEISRGNGYWFAVGERDLLEKYVFGDVPQEFNPIAEAPTVLSTEKATGHTASFNPSDPNRLVYAEAEAENEANSNSEKSPESVNDESPSMGPTSSSDDLILPGDEDLDYPDIGLSDSGSAEEKRNDITQVISREDLVAEKEVPPNRPPERPEEELPVADPDTNEEVGAIPDESDLEYPDMPSAPQSEAAASSEDESDDESDFEFSVDIDRDPVESEEEVLEAPQESENDSIETEAANSSDSILESDELDDLDISVSGLEADKKKIKKTKPALSKGAAPPPKPKTSSKKEKKKSTLRSGGTAEVSPSNIKKRAAKLEASEQSEATSSGRSDRYLFLLLGLIIAMILVAIYYYGKALNRSVIPFVGHVQAQSLDTISGKKKVNGLLLDTTMEMFESRLALEERG